MTNTPQWIWQQPDWPKFAFDMKVVAPVLNRARSAQGRILGKAQALGLANLGAALAEIWVEEANATARIEGEKLDLNAVRSSVARRLGMASVGTASRAVEGLIDLMDDATRHWREPLTVERLCGWQAALFPTGFAGVKKVKSGALRTHATPMQIVSGPIGREKVHFEAPPSKRLPRELGDFLAGSKARVTVPSTVFSVPEPRISGSKHCTHSRMAMAVSDAPSSTWPWRRTPSWINGSIAFRGVWPSTAMTTTRSWRLPPEAASTSRGGSHGSWSNLRRRVARPRQLSICRWPRHAFGWNTGKPRSASGSVRQ